MRLALSIIVLTVLVFFCLMLIVDSMSKMAIKRHAKQHFKVDFDEAEQKPQTEKEDDDEKPTK